MGRAREVAMSKRTSEVERVEAKAETSGLKRSGATTLLFYNVYISRRKEMLNEDSLLETMFNEYEQFNETQIHNALTGARRKVRVLEEIRRMREIVATSQSIFEIIGTGYAILNRFKLSRALQFTMHQLHGRLVLYYATDAWDDTKEENTRKLGWYHTEEISELMTNQPSMPNFIRFIYEEEGGLVERVISIERMKMPHSKFKVEEEIIHQPKK